MDVGSLAVLLRETEERHGPYEANSPKHHWSSWYAAFVVARTQGRTGDEAAAAAGEYVDQELASEQATV